jgi:hypothetical protein
MQSMPAPSRHNPIQTAKPDFLQSMERLEAWFAGEILDRPVVCFNSTRWEPCPGFEGRTWPTLRDRWFDVEYQVETYAHNAGIRSWLGESFPVYYPNLGPNVYSAFYGCPQGFGENTAWSEPFLSTWDDLNRIAMDWDSPYFKKLDELTDYAFERGAGHFLTGYTDLHPGVDCVASWRDSQDLCLDLFDEPETVHRAIELAYRDFQTVYDRFDTKLKAAGQPSASWMGIPSFGKMHIPSCDFSALIGKDQFEEFCIPYLQREVLPMTHNIFHLDGPEASRHVDRILEVSGIQAIQWVQGVGDDQPILQWIPLIKRIQAAGRSVVVYLKLDELEPFLQAVSPKGILINVPAGEEDLQRRILKRLETWR